MKVKLFDNKVEIFINSLDTQIVPRLLRTLDLLLVFGHELGLPHSKKLGRASLSFAFEGNKKFACFILFMAEKRYYYTVL